MNFDILTTIIAGVVILIVAKFVQSYGASKPAVNSAPTQTQKKKDTRLQDASKFITPDSWHKFPLVEREVLSHNVRRFRFKLPEENSPLGLPIGKHIIIRATLNGEEVQRKYTPTTLNDTLGHFDLVVKVYEKGLISKYLDELKIGDEIEVQGPAGRFWLEENRSRAFGMLAGGTGITPMYQLIQALLKDKQDKTQISLIFANIGEEDILLRKDLELLQSANPDRFKLFYCLNNAPEGWTGGVGFVTQDMIAQHLPPPADDIKILLCGPPPMLKAMYGHLEKIGYDFEKQVFKF